MKIFSIYLFLVFIGIFQNAYSQQTLSIDTFAIDSFNNVIEKAYSTNNDSIIANSEYSYACFLTLDKGYDEMSIPHFDNAIEYFTKYNDNLHLAKCYYFKYSAYFKKGGEHNNKSIEDLLKAIKYAEYANDSALMIAIYTSLATIQIIEHKTSEGINTIRKAIGFSKTVHDTDNLIVLYFNLGNTFYVTKEYDSVLYYYDVSRNYILSSARLSKKLGSNYGNTALTYLEINNVTEALKNAQKADSVFSSFNNVLGLSWVYHIYSKAYFMQDDYDKAIEFSDKSLALGIQINSLNTQLDAYLLKYTIYKKKKDFGSALINMEKYKELFDKINNEKRYKETEKLLNSYEFYKKEQQVKLLKATDVIKTQTIKTQSLRIRLVIIIGIFIFIIFIIIIYSYYTKYKSSMELLRKNLELEKHEDNKNCKKTINDTVIDEKDKKIIDDWHENIFNQKIYKRTDCSVDLCAEILKTNRSYLSKALNNYFNKSFTSLINEYRISEAKFILKSNEAKKYTIEAIAEQSGFNNKVSFTAAFKKYTGLTPGFYRDNAAKVLDTY